MRKIVFLWVSVIFAIYADESKIDRTGYHTGLGGSGFLFTDEPIILPTFDLTLEYGMTHQSTLLLEHHGYFIAGLVALEYKYYLENDRDTFYVMGGAVGAYALDYGGELDTGVFKAGLGYAWNHVESDITVIGDSTDIVPTLTVRYKF